MRKRKMYDPIEREWDDFVYDIEHMQLDPWLDTTYSNWLEQFIAYSYVLEMGKPE